MTQSPINPAEFFDAMHALHLAANALNHDGKPHTVSTTRPNLAAIVKLLDVDCLHVLRSEIDRELDELRQQQQYLAAGGLLAS